MAKKRRRVTSYITEFEFKIDKLHYKVGIRQEKTPQKTVDEVTSIS